MSNDATFGEPLIKVDAFFGWVRIESRLRPVGNRIIGEGRSWHYDGNGSLIKDTGWQPTGVSMYWDSETIPPSTTPTT